MRKLEVVQKLTPSLSSMSVLSPSFGPSLSLVRSRRVKRRMESRKSSTVSNASRILVNSAPPPVIRVAFFWRC